jgi:hypothetical protein
MGNLSFRTTGREVEIRLNRDLFSDEFINFLLNRIRLELIAVQTRSEVTQEVVDELVEKIQLDWWKSEGEPFIKRFMPSR